MAESEEELRSLLMRVKEESAKVGLKLNIKKTKIMASGPLTSWQIDGEEMEVVTDFIFLGSKITTDRNCSQEIKRHLVLGRKAMANLDSIPKSRDITLPTKVRTVKAMVFPVAMSQAIKGFLGDNQHLELGPDFNGKPLKLTEDWSYIRMASTASLTAAASLVSLAWALASYQKALRDSRDDKKPISYMAVIIQFCWHFFTIAARVITFALFASVFQLYFGIFIVLHWCIMTFWIVHCETEFCITKWEEIVFDMVVGIIYIFSWFNVKEGRTRCRLFIYYFVILLENTALSALWYLYKVPMISDAFAIPALCVVFSSFLTGIVFMLMYYAFFHPNGPRFGQTPSCACEDSVAAFTLPPEVASSTLRSISNNRSVTSERDQKFAERDGCVPVFQVRPTAPSTPSSRPPRIEESVIKIDLFRNRYPAWERHVLDRSLRKAILAFECSPAPPRLQYKDDALIQERLEYETTL
ncbi:XK-related protein 4 [Varanus komodoensis]|nr:XK-related protein 4 [Varanus komodoensis]